jgi:hypothetical protein
LPMHLKPSANSLLCDPVYLVKRCARGFARVGAQRRPTSLCPTIPRRTLHIAMAMPAGYVEKMTISLPRECALFLREKRHCPNADAWH